VTNQLKVCDASAEGLLRPVSRTCTRENWLPLVDALRTLLLAPAPDMIETLDVFDFCALAVQAGHRMRITVRMRRNLDLRTRIGS